MLRIIFLALTILLATATTSYASYEDGKRAYQRGDWINAIRELRPLAEKEDDKALLLLGHMYNGGKGVIKNPAEALSLYLRSAKENNTYAMISIAAMYEAGIGFNPNPELAQKWFEHAAMMGNQSAAFFNAIILFKGDPTGQSKLLQDTQNAYKWFLIASKMTENKKITDNAAEMAKITAGRLKKTEIGKAQKEAAVFKPISPENMPPLPEHENK